MTANLTDQQTGRGALHRIRQVYSTHRDFVFLLVLFAVLQLMLLVLFAPGGRFGDYSDYWYYQEMASRLDGGYYPYVHYWVEYPPLFPWLPVGAYWLSHLLPPAPQPQLWFYAIFGLLMGLFAIGNLVMVYLLGLQLHDRPGAQRCAWFYALLFGPIFVHAGWFDGVALFFMLWSLYLLFKNRAVLSGMVAGVGAMVKVLPLALAPVGFKILSRRWRYLASIGLVLVAVNLPFYLLNPILFTASWRALLTQPSWETVWALLDGYYSYGLVLGNRFDPAQAGSGQRPEFVPWSAVLVVFGLAYLAVYLLPWQRHQPDRASGAHRNRLRAVVDQFLYPVMRDGNRAVNRLGVVAFVGLSLNLFMIFSRGYSPQFVLWHLPFLVLVLPNGWGLTYATLLTIDSVVERILYFFVLPDAHWLLAGTVLFRTVLMLLLIPEFLAVMGFLSLPRWRRVQRWLLPPAALAMLVLLGLGVGAFARDYRQLRYAASSLRHVVDRIQGAALSGDGLVVTSREAFDALAPYLPDQEARLYTRDDGEFRPAAFEAQWAGFVSRHPRIWLLLDYAGGQNADWNAYLMELLGQSGYQTVDEWVGEEQRLVHYAATAPVSVRAEDLNAIIGDEVELVRVKLDAEPLRGGEVLRLKLRWRPLLKSGREYKVFLHLVSVQGQIFAQRDVPVEDGTWPNRAGLLLPRGLDPGAYRLRIGVYDPATGDRLPVSTGKDHLVIEGVEIR
jgi:hypothetical protein